MFRVVSKETTSPAQLLKQMNDHVAAEATQPDGMFITYVYGVYDGAAGTLTYSNAGHFPPLCYRKRTGVFEPLESSGLPIGIMPGQDYAEETVRFESGDVLVMYTDGVIEASDKSGEMFGLERLKELVSAHAAETAAATAARISDAVNGFAGTEPQHDDMTLIVIKAVGLN